MNILFIGTPLPASVESYLRENGVSWTTLRSPDLANQASGIRFDLAVLTASDEHPLSSARTVHATCEIRSLSLVLDTQGSPSIDALLQSPLQEVWSKESWEFSFFRAIERILRERTMVSEFEGLKEEIHELHSLHEKLGATTNHLVGRIQKDIDSARSLQSSLLRTPSNSVPGVDLLVKYVSAPGRGGDYYDVFDLEQRKRLGLLLIDARTHGLVASALDALLPLEPRASLALLSQPKEMVKYMVEHLRTSFPKVETEVSLWYAVLDRATLKLRLCNHGGLDPLVWRKNHLHTIESDAGEEAIFSLEPGDRLLLFSDGMHQIWAPNKDWKTPVAELLLRTGNHEMRDFQNELLAEIEAVKERTTLTDDITCLQLQVDSRALFSLK